MRKATIRVLAAHGRYPTYSVELPGHLLSCSDRLVWSAVATAPPNPEIDDSEVAVYCREEIRLYGAAMLAVNNPSNHRFLNFEPKTWGRAFVVPFVNADFHEAEVRQWLEGQVSNVASEGSAESLQPIIPSPTGYELVDQGSPEDCKELIEAIDSNDDLCLRGLSKLLVASSLRAHPWYVEEAALAAYISLEAALEMIRQHLEDENGKAAFQDVFDYVEQTFPHGAPFAAFLQELYDLTILLVHPSSRFGEYWAPPMSVDDCWEAFECLIALYRHILLGEVWEPDAA